MFFMGGRDYLCSAPAARGTQLVAARTPVHSTTVLKLRVPETGAIAAMAPTVQHSEARMDLSFTPEEQKFREEIRAWVKENLPKDISHKVHNALELTRDDLQGWAKILGKKGWLGYGWPKEFGGPGWTAIQRHLFEEETALAGAPRIIPFGPVMVAPVIMAFGNAEQQKRFLPGIASGEIWWSQGYSEPGSGSDLASVKTKAQRVTDGQGDRYIVNGQKTWTTLGQYGDWMFNLVRTSNEGKPQTGISFLLLDMKSPGVTVRPIKLLDGGHEVNEVFFDNVEVPAENLIGEENKGWTYAKHLLSHERTNIADVNRAKRELERLKRIAKSEGVYDDMRFRDEIAKLEVDIVALEMMVLRVLSAATSGKNSLDVAGLLKIRGSEIQQRYSELMMLAGGAYSLPLIREAMEAGWQGDFPGGNPALAPLASTFFNMRKTTIYGGSNEVQRNIVAQTVLG
jgi:alkylation response protein AidB-like acyl-CoA dehydrogenase